MSKVMNLFYHLIGFEVGIMLRKSGYFVMSMGIIGVSWRVKGCGEKGVDRVRNL